MQLLQKCNSYKTQDHIETAFYDRCVTNVCCVMKLVVICLCVTAIVEWVSCVLVCLCVICDFWFIVSETAGMEVVFLILGSMVHVD
jgi:hypothetical protein